MNFSMDDMQEDVWAVETESFSQKSKMIGLVTTTFAMSCK
uniref:Uncharacterized protein n=1 Tax=Acrobeloides nanus TaxID=290746 RepID=A0A914DPX8_9BILA